MLVRIANAQLAEHYIHAPPNLEVSWSLALALDSHVDASRAASGQSPTHSHHLDQPVKVCHAENTPGLVLLLRVHL